MRTGQTGHEGRTDRTAEEEGDRIVRTLGLGLGAQQCVARPVCVLAGVGQSDPAHAGRPRAARKLQTPNKIRSNEL